MDPLDEALENLQSASLGLTSLLNGCMDDDLPGEEVSSALAAQVTDAQAQAYPPGQDGPAAAPAHSAVGRLELLECRAVYMKS